MAAEKHVIVLVDVGEDNSADLQLAASPKAKIGAVSIWPWACSDVLISQVINRPTDVHVACFDAMR